MSVAVRDRAWRSAFDAVVLVASSGGLDAITIVVRALPATFPVPVCVVLHRSPDYPDYVVRLLARSTTLTVRAVASGDPVAVPGVAVVPAGMAATVTSDGCYALCPSSEVQHRAGNCLLQGLADTGRRVVAVVLTGRMDDGAAGARATKRTCGRVLVEEPASAKASGMPTATLATGCVDFALPLHRIAPALVALVEVPGAADLLRVPLPAWAS